MRDTKFGNPTRRTCRSRPVRTGQVVFYATCTAAILANHASRWKPTGSGLAMRLGRKYGRTKESTPHAVTFTQLLPSATRVADLPRHSLARMCREKQRALAFFQYPGDRDSSHAVGDNGCFVYRRRMAQLNTIASAVITIPLRPRGSKIVLQLAHPMTIAAPMPSDTKSLTFDAVLGLESDCPVLTYH